MLLTNSALTCGFIFGFYKNIINKIPSDDFEESKSTDIQNIKNDMVPLLNELGIRKDLMFLERDTPGIFQAFGTNVFKRFDAAVFICKDFYRADKEACYWTIKHELSHIKYNDQLIIRSVPFICQLAACLFGMRVFRFLPALGVVSLTGWVTISLFSKWREAQADDFAIKNSSDEELRGGRRFLLASKELYLEERNESSWGISASGNNRLDLLHPSITSRIQKIERALSEKNAEIDQIDDRDKIDSLKNSIRSLFIRLRTNRN